MADLHSCPKCQASLQSQTGETLPSRCPECGTRVTCPECGSMLESRLDDPERYRCPRCKVEIGAAETIPITLPGEATTSVPFALPGFEMRGELGRGGMGIVYRAYQRSLHREVAVKVLPPLLAQDPTTLARFRNEATVAAGLVDAHILPVFDVLDVQGVPVIVMPVVEGTDLGRIVRERREIKTGHVHPRVHPWATLDDQAYLDAVLPVLDELIAAVARLHRAGVLHRDIKPSNVLVDRHGGLWLSDFGLARFEGEGVGTRPGQMVGTLGYASPEQACGEQEIDFRADLFSLGVTLYQVLTLELPYGKRGGREGASPPTAPHDRQPLLPEAFNGVLLRCLELRPEQRYAATEEFEEDWRQARAGVLPRSQPARLLARPAGRFRPQRAVVWTGLLTLLALSVVGAFVLFGSPSGRTVQVTTNPPGARLTFVPLDPVTGEPMPDRALRPQTVTPVRLEYVPPGEYLLVAVLEGHGFHEVYRTVPPAGHMQRSLEFRHRDFDQQPDGTIALPSINIPSGDVTKSMAYFPGGDFAMGSANLSNHPVHVRHLPAYYLDPTEVTIGAYRAVRRLPATLAEGHAPDDEPVRWVTFDAALSVAEEMGKRLPDEAEFEFAATRGGTALYPWGNDETKLRHWPFGKAGQPDFDKVPGPVPVYGLYSNVAEWTVSWYRPYPNSEPQILAAFYSPEGQAEARGVHVVRGGPFPVISAEPDPGKRDHRWNPRYRCGISADRAFPGLGFRCARSAKPRFVGP
jgi:formylglycine-generating enzyme required for sulfatase activity